MFFCIIFVCFLAWFISFNPGHKSKTQNSFKLQLFLQPRIWTNLKDSEGVGPIEKARVGDSTADALHPRDLKRDRGVSVFRCEVSGLFVPGKAYEHLFLSAVFGHNQKTIPVYTKAYRYETQTLSTFYWQKPKHYIIDKTQSNPIFRGIPAVFVHLTKKAGCMDFLCANVFEKTRCTFGFPGINFSCN